jgi:toxin HigB-1
VIVSFKCSETRRIFEGFVSLHFPPDIQRVALRKLQMLGAAVSINDLRVPPKNCLKKLDGDRKGQYSIRINDQWRICFVLQGQGSFSDVEIVDYH